MESAVGQKLPWRRRNATSGLPPRPDILDPAGHVGFVPTGDIGQEIYLREEQKPEALAGQTAICGIDRHDIIQMAIEPT